MPVIKTNFPDKISLLGAKKIKDKMTIMTFCYSKTVLNILRTAHAQGKRFIVRLSETRPNFTGRIMAKKLVKIGIPVAFTVDLAALQNLKESQLLLLGADALTNDGYFINKFGTALLIQIANQEKVPIYLCTSIEKARLSNTKNLILKKRDLPEVWKKAPKGIILLNPAYNASSFYSVNGIISELGILKPAAFMKKISLFYSSSK